MYATAVLVTLSLFSSLYCTISTLERARDPVVSKLTRPFNELTITNLLMLMYTKTHRHSHEVCSLQVPPDDAAHELIGVGEVLQ